jgi:hypothetical protein
VDDGEPPIADTEGMTFTDYLIDFTLIGLVLLQVRGRRLTTRALLLPLGIVAYVALNYLHGIPTAGNDLVLILGCAAIGALLGSLSGLLTSVRADGDGVLVAKAGLVAAGLWILGTGTRLVFQFYASHGGGGAIARFSAAHDITSAEAWTAALILMALCEVVLRTGILSWRAAIIRQHAPGTAANPQNGRSAAAGWGSIMESGEHAVR